MKVFGIAGFSGAGKTTLIERLIPLFTGRGMTVSLIKHTHHDFDIDRPGKDSYRHRLAGATEVMLVADARWVLMHESRGRQSDLDEQLARLSPCDLVLVEGYKQSPIPKLEVHRPANGKPLICGEQPSVIAVACDRPGAIEAPVPVLDLADVEGIAAFILAAVGLHGQTRGIEPARAASP
jgi:molybdopterin-guanine dinucleotide biosynthesis protein B